MEGRKGRAEWNNKPSDRRTDGRLATHLQEEEEEGEALRISTLSSTLAFPSSPLTDIAPLAFPPSLGLYRRCGKCNEEGIVGVT